MSELDIDARLTRGAFTLNARARAPLGGVTALFGPSGAGKSLLLSALAGLQPITSGRIALAGRVLDAPAEKIHVPPHQRGIGLVFQDARLFPHLSVRGNLLYARERAPAHKLSLDEAAAHFDVAALLDRPVRNLSGGEKSRVALARALLSAPDLLLLDEPFAALDGARRRAFLATLRAMHVRFDLPMMVVTHQIDDVAALASSVIGLKGGAVVAQGNLAETAPLPAFQALLDRADIGAAVPARALHGGTVRGAAWLRADQVLLARARPEAISARNIWEARIASLTHEADGAVLARLDADFGALFSRVTQEAAAELDLSPGAPIWAIAKAHAF